MHKDSCFFLGYITKPKGLKGEVSIKLDTDQPERYHGLDAVFISMDTSDHLIPFFFTSMKVNDKGQATGKFEGIDTQAQAKDMQGRELYLPLDALPKLEGNAFYYHEVIGFEVHDTEHGNIGKVKEVQDEGPQALLVIKEGPREILLPITDDFVTGIDRGAQTLSVRMPEGLLDLF